jgi:acetylornithine deacetylase/succinyl-diaminopimelate desuccinylase-like protein
MFPCRFLNRRMSVILVFLATGFAPRADGASPTLDDVLARIDRQALIELKQTLVRIRSDYSEGSLANHNEIAAFLASELKNLGMEVTVLEPTPRFPMVVGRLAGTRGTPVLGTMGHYHTVPVGDPERWSREPFGAEIVDGRIYGRGAADQKSGIAALLAATRAIVESGVKLRGTLLHAYIPGEGAQEHVLPLVADAEPERIRADWHLDTDGGPDIIQVAAGHIWLKITKWISRSANLGGGSHAPDEWADIEGIYRSAQVYAEILLKILE